MFGGEVRVTSCWPSSFFRICESGFVRRVLPQISRRPPKLQSLHLREVYRTHLLHFRYITSVFVFVEPVNAPEVDVGTNGGAALLRCRSIFVREGGNLSPGTKITGVIVGGMIAVHAHRILDVELVHMRPTTLQIVSQQVQSTG